VADKVVRRAECSALVIGPNPGEDRRWLDVTASARPEAMLVPLDGSRASESALPVARSLAASSGALLHLVQVAQIPWAYYSDPLDGYTPAEVVDEPEEMAQAYLERIAASLNGLRVKVEVLTGAAASTLQDYSVGNRIDLVVMASHHRSGLARLAFADVSDRLLRGPAPVLLVHAASDQRPERLPVAQAAPRQASIAA
jgi:nucleotide-binding universal stress UspA family protein